MRSLARLAVFTFLVSAPVSAQTVFPVGSGSATSAGFSADVSIGGIIGQVTGAAFATHAGFIAVVPTSPPFGVLPPFTVVAGDDVAVTALIEDDVQVVSATLHYRPGGDGTFTTLPMTLTDADTGEWTATIPGAEVDVRGVQYFVDASDGVESGTLPATAFASVAVNVPNHPAFDLAAETYALAGAPLRPNNPDPLAVFGALGPYEPKAWRYGTFDPVQARYEEPGAAANVVPGQGFWVIAKEAASIAVTGRSTDLSTDVAVSLQPGFNQIANPFAFPVAFSDVTLPAGVDANLIGWNGTAYVNGQTTLTPGQGYWIFNDTGANASLLIPPRGAGAAARAPSSPPGRLAPNPTDGSWEIAVRVRAGRFQDSDNRFGMRAGATADKDAFDFADAPAPPGGYAVASFLSADVALLTDWRAPDPDGATWTLELRSDQVGEAFRIDFASEAEMPLGWLLLAIPESGRETVDLTETGELSGRVGSSAMAQRWTITAGRPAFVRNVEREVRAGLDAAVNTFSLSAPFPNPARVGRGTSLELAMPSRSDAQVVVYDVTGRRVSTLWSGTLAQGRHRIAWNAMDSSGRSVASGVYFVQAHAGEHSKRQKIVLTR